jgi:hypothetical protein
MTQLLRWDLNKNFTWGVGPSGQVECECGDIEEDSPFVPLQVPPEAVSGGSVTIQQGSAKTEVAVTKMELEIPFFENLDFYVDSEGDLRRATTKLAVGDDQAGLSIENTQDFWNIKHGVSEADFRPHPNCKCEKKGVKPAIAESKPAVLANPNLGCSATDGCKCLEAPGKTAQNSDLVFCKDIVKYPVTKALLVKETDAFAATAHQNSVLTGESAECDQKYKEFLCLFYFQECKDGVKTYPKEFADGSCTGNPAKGTAADSFYVETENLNAGLNAAGGEGDVDYSAAPVLCKSWMVFLGVVAVALSF